MPRDKSASITRTSVERAAQDSNEELGHDQHEPHIGKYVEEERPDALLFGEFLELKWV
jgi:hypothetical protein